MPGKITSRRFKEIHVTPLDSRVRAPKKRETPQSNKGVKDLKPADYSVGNDPVNTVNYIGTKFTI